MHRHTHKALIAILALATLGFAGQSMARAQYYSQPYDQARLYAGLNLSMNQIKVDGQSWDPSVIALGVQGGVEISPYFALEGRLSHGVEDDKKDSQKIKQKLSYGIYAKGILPFNDLYSAYGLVGFSQLRFDGTGDNDQGSVHDFSYGAGLTINAADATAVNLEYARLYKKDGFTVNGITLSVNFRL